MLSQIIAEELPFIALQPFLGIADNGGILTGQRTYHFLLTNEQVGTMVVQTIHGRERTFSVRNEHIGRYCIVA